MSVHMEFELHALLNVHVADGKGYMCIRNTKRSIRGREGLLDALTTFVLHLLIWRWA